MPKLKSILIAEDEPDTANLFSFICNDAGITPPVGLPDGASTLNLSFERRPDLVDPRLDAAQGTWV